METQEQIKLYQRDHCPYCQSVRKKLESLNLTTLLIPVPPDAADREDLFAASGQRSVPVLVDGQNVLTDSDAIINYLDDTYGDGKRTAPPSNSYGIRVKVKGSFEDVIEKTVAALKTVGFGVLTEIDVKKTLKKKLDVDVPKQMILGACNPNFAHQAMEAEADLGLLLPCNVVVREPGDGEFWVSTVNPLKLLSVVGRADMLPMAEEVKQKLSGAMESLTV